MKYKIYSLFALILCLNAAYNQIQAQRSITGTWAVVDYKLKKKVTDKDKLNFMLNAAKQTEFNFMTESTLFIKSAFMSNPTLYKWRFTDSKQTLIEAIEDTNDDFLKPSKWTLKVVKQTPNTLHLEDLDPDKQGNVWICRKK